MQKMWEGRFKETSSKLLEDFNASISFDKALYKEDINGSIAHATMLCECGILTNDEKRHFLVSLGLSHLPADEYVAEVLDC